MGNPDSLLDDEISGHVAPIERRFEEVERRLAFRLDAHQAALDRCREPANHEEDPTVRRVDLVMPTSSAPLVSIIIPVHGAIDDLMACLRSIVKFRLRDPFEVIVANDASPESDFAPDTRCRSR